MNGRRICAIIFWTLLALPAWTEEHQAPSTLAELQERLLQHLSQPKFSGALWGVKIVSQDSGQTIFEHNPGKLFSPASNCKLFTVALALDQLGPDYRIKTSVYAQRKPDAAGRLEGNLVVYGRGDPTINARLHHGDLFAALEPLVHTITNSGVKLITGDLVGDATFFHGPTTGSGWAWDDLQYDYGAPISSLTVNDNVLQLSVRPADHPGVPCSITLGPETAADILTVSNRTLTSDKSQPRNIRFFQPPGAHVLYVFGQLPAGDRGYGELIPVPDPARLFAVLLRQALVRAGVRLEGRIRSLSWPDTSDVSQLVELGSVESLPLRDIVREIEKPSQNLYADLLLAHVGENFRSPAESAEASSEAEGIRRLRQLAAKAGIHNDQLWFEEGSGLSRDNLATPDATVALLQFMSRHDCRQIFLDALPIAGVDGTLKNRMAGTPAANNVRAKTGSLRWANSLSGYVTTAAGEHWLFSIMLNRYDNLGNRPPRSEIDVIPVLLAGFTGRSQTPK